MCKCGIWVSAGGSSVSPDQPSEVRKSAIKVFQHQPRNFSRACALTDPSDEPLAVHLETKMPWLKCKWPLYGGVLAHADDIREY